MVTSVLVVDDNEADVHWCRRIFRKTGRYGSVLVAATGEEAIQLFVDQESSRAAHPQAFPPALILLDINMPVMDGFEFLERFEAFHEAAIQQGSTPSVVIMLSSSNDERDRNRASQFRSVHGFLTKPLTMATAVELADQLAGPP